MKKRKEFLVILLIIMIINMKFQYRSGCNKKNK